MEFIRKVKFDTVYSAHTIDSLGFGYVIEYGNYNYNNHISFLIEIIRKDDSIYSYSLEPTHGWGPNIMLDGDLYVLNYEKAGWQLKEWDDFYERYYNYDFSILPVNYNSNNEINNNPLFKYLMSPYSGYVFINDFRSFELQEIFNDLSQQLNQNDIYYLLHSMNPATRAIVIKFVKCNREVYNDEINDRIELLINNSPQLRTHSGCFIEYEDLTKFVKCF